MASAPRATTAGAQAFVYLAAGGTGARTFGVRRARDRRELHDKLRRDRLVPLRAWAMPSLGAESVGRLGLKDQTEIHAQLGQLLGRAVPLVEALEVTASAVSARVRPRIDRLRELVAAGSNFADACRDVEAFDPVTIAVYQAAERTGDLAGSARQLAATTRRQARMGEKAVTLMIYPAIVLTVSVLVTLGMLTMIVPKIGASLRGSGMELPAITRLMIAAGEFLRSHWIGSLAVALGAVGLVVVMRDVVFALVRRLVRAIPACREVMSALESARFFTVMAAMTRAGVPIAEGLATATHAVHDAHFRRELGRLRTRLIEGGVLRSLLNDVTSLPPATRRLLIAGERSGDLETVFESLAGDMTDEVERRSDRLLAALEPTLILVMACMIGSVILSIMIPLLRLTGQVG